MDNILRINLQISCYPDRGLYLKNSINDSEFCLYSSLCSAGTGANYALTWPEVCQRAGQINTQYVPRVKLPKDFHRKVSCLFWLQKQKCASIPKRQDDFFITHGPIKVVPGRKQKLTKQLYGEELTWPEDRFDFCYWLLGDNLGISCLIGVLLFAWDLGSPQSLIWFRVQAGHTVRPMMWFQA